jgi:hypothetical protein
MFRPTVVIIVAFVSGLLGALVVTHRTPPPARAAEVDAETPTVTADAMRAPLAALAAATAAAAREPQPQPDRQLPAPSNDREDDAHADRAHELVVHASLIETHLSAARDTAWASDHEAKLKASYAGLAAQAGFELRQVDCRTHTCVLDLEFPSFAAARAGVQDLVLRQDVVCGKRVTLPDGGDPNGRLVAQVFVDCPERS